VMHAKHQQSSVGLIPGGTANVWASEIGVSDDPVKAALKLINSEAEKVDIGHVAVNGLTFPQASEDEQHQQGKKSRRKQAKAAAKVRQHFLLMAGLGLDAAIMGHVSQPLKYRVGALAVGVSTAKELPANRPFPIEIWAGDANNEGIHWKGEALQVVIGNTRLYADIVQMTPDAYIDDGLLDVCVITAGNPLTTMQQIASLLLRHHPDNVTAEYFQGAHFSLSVPASVALQLDGSAVKLKDYLSQSERQALAREAEVEQVMVAYQFDAMPRALPMAIPRTYSGILFEASDSAHEQQTGETAQTEGGEEAVQNEKPQKEQQATHLSEQEQQEFEQSKVPLQGGRKVTVVGVSPDPAAKETYIVAGSITKQSTGEAQPVAIRVDADTLVREKTGELAPLEGIRVLHTGSVILVEGKKSKRGVILAKQLVL
jgi:diacylglycerol kinase family enzyme